MIGPNIRIKTDGGRMVLLGESTSFGRHPRNGIRLEHRTVSRFHGLFVRLPTGGYRVVDLGTKNGIRVNSWRIEESAALDTGDQIAAGNQVMVYESGDADDVESVSGLMTTLLVSTSGADPGDSTNGLELDAGASGLGVVTLSSLDAVESISETAGQWFDFYFPDNKRKGRVLPGAIAEWLRPQVKVADDGRLVIQPDLPFAHARGERRLCVRVQLDADRSRIFLFCTDERPLFCEQQLRADFAVEFQLTPREAEAVFYVALGKTNPEIGVILGTSERTIHKHLQNAYRKLRVENRKALIVFVYDFYKENLGVR